MMPGKDKNQTFHATMLVTRAEEWCVDAASPEEAKALLERAKAIAAHPVRFFAWRWAIFCELAGVHPPLSQSRYLDVRFGSKADICAAKSRVRFTPQKRTCAVQLGISAKCQ